MNYIKQRRAFDAFKRTHLKQISLRMVAAWDAIFDALNERQWPEQPTIIGRYELLMRFPGSADTLKRAIDELSSIGLVRVVAETAMSDAAYELVQLYEEEHEQTGTPNQEQDGADQNGRDGDARRTAAESPQKPAEFAADLRGICGETAPEQEGGTNVLSLDRARARTRENVNPNVTPNPNANIQQQAEAEEETRARREDPPAGGEWHREEEGAARAAAAPGCRQAVQNIGDEGSEHRRENEQAGQSEKRVFETARGCGFSMSKRNKERLRTMLSTYGADWTCAAIDRAALRGACGLGYVAAILSSWSQNGGMDDPGALAGKVNKHAEKDGYSRENMNTQNKYTRFNPARDYEQRTYTKEEDNALFVDFFAGEEIPV